MIPIPGGVRVWIATGHTDMRRGMQGLALTVQESLKREALHAAPHVGVACRDPDPDAAWDRNHRRPRNVATIKSAHADALMLTRAPPGSSTTIADAN